MAQKKRNINIEILRTLSMFMIVVLHFLNYGKVLESVKGGFSFVNFYAFLIEALCIVAVNVYILISSYFLYEKKFQMKRIIRVLCEVWIYSILIGIVGMILGWIPFSISNLIHILFPILLQQYWFVNAYIMLLFLIPFFNPFVKTLSKKRHSILLILLLIFNSIIPLFTKSAVSLTTGNSLTWFVNLYLIASYFKKYPVTISSKYFLLIYIGTSFLLALSALVVLDQFGFGKALHFYKYNSILVLLSSLSLFLIFLKPKKISEKIEKIILFFSSSTFAVYILHENYFLRNLIWNKWVSLSPTFTICIGTLSLIGICLLIFILSILIDKVVGRLIHKISIPMPKIDQILNEESAK